MPWISADKKSTMNEQQGESQRKPRMTDDKENLNEDSFVSRRTCLEPNTVLPQSLKPSALSQTIHSKNDRRREAMTMTVSHAHVTHGTSGRKGEKVSSVTHHTDRHSVASDQ